MHRLTLLLIALAFVPAGHAAFGPESPDGYPINVDGQVIYPPVPNTGSFLLESRYAWQYGGPASVPSGPVDDAREPINKAGPFTLYPYYPLLTAELQRLAEDHPDLVRLTSVGQSRLGLDIWMLEIADFDNPDRIPLAAREVVYIDGGTHSNEYSGVYFVTEWAQFLLDEYDDNETAQWIVQNRHTYLVPMVNPDGSNLFGRINAAGVNINRNFPSTWGTTDEQPPMNYPGPYPASEPETQVVVDLFRTLRPDYAASIHCCGNMWLYPYGAEHLGDPIDNPHLQRICDEVYAEVRETCGPIWSTIYPAGGNTADEAYEVAGSSAWGFEMSGRGAVAPWGQPIIQNDVREQEKESWAGVMHAFLNVDKYGALPKIVAMEGTTRTLTVTVENMGWGNVSQGALEVAGKKVALPDLEPGQTATFQFSGDFQKGAVPVEMTWKKRLHPESGFGDKRFAAELVEVATGKLAAVIADGTVAELPAPQFSQREEAPAPSVALLLAAALALLAVARRRRS